MGAAVAGDLDLAGRSLSSRRAEAAERYGVAGEAHLFVGTYEGPLSDRELVERCWDLPAIASAYDAVHRSLPRRASIASAQRGDAQRRGGVRRASLAGARLPQIRLRRPGPAERTGAGTLARDDRRRGIFREYYAVLDAKISTIT